MGNIKKIVRCIRNNNPLNIRRGTARWKGMSKREDDEDFEQFETMAYGWRAAFILLGRTYYEKYHLNTIQKIISRWAPACENKTDAYMMYVSINVGINECDPLPSPKLAPAIWMRIAWAMFEVEAGRKAANDPSNKELFFQSMKEGFDMFNNS
jgi:hypothetical protein